MCSVGYFFEGEFYSDADIAPFALAMACAAETSAIAAISACAKVRVYTGVTVSIIFLLFVRVCQNFICFVSFFKVLFRLSISRV